MQVIYETANPENAQVYKFFGYWMTWGELLATVIIYFLLFQVAVNITKNPDANALIEQLEYKEGKKTKYES